jgi:hypothetical protein
MKNDKDRREQAHDKMRETLAPYHARCVAEWHDKKAKDDLYLFLLCSREADANDGEAYRWRGVVCVRIMPDGTTVFFHDEGLVSAALNLKREDTWSRTESVLDRLVPNLPADKHTEEPRIA